MDKQIKINLLLPDEEIWELIQPSNSPMEFGNSSAKAELNYLADLGVIYVYQGADIYIPLSDYLKEGK